MQYKLLKNIAIIVKKVLRQRNKKASLSAALRAGLRPVALCTPACGRV